jgi:hypothetical protein
MTASSIDFSGRKNSAASGAIDVFPRILIYIDRISRLVKLGGLSDVLGSNFPPLEKGGRGDLKGQQGL